jgi:hypothetical protein
MPTPIPAVIASLESERAPFAVVKEVLAMALKGKIE